MKVDSLKLKNISNSPEYIGYDDLDEISVIHSDVCLTFKIPVEHIQHWKKCSLIANFFGNYQAESYKNHKKQIVSIISTISNELLENAIKFMLAAFKINSTPIRTAIPFLLVMTPNIPIEKRIAAIYK